MNIERTDSGVIIEGVPFTWEKISHPSAADYIAHELGVSRLFAADAVKAALQIRHGTKPKHHVAANRPLLFR
jgi:hypothetical protein